MVTSPYKALSKMQLRGIYYLARELEDFTTQDQTLEVIKKASLMHDEYNKLNHDHFVPMFSFDVKEKGVCISMSTPSSKLIGNIELSEIFNEKLNSNVLSIITKEPVQLRQISFEY